MARTLRGLRPSHYAASMTPETARAADAAFHRLGQLDGVSLAPAWIGPTRRALRDLVQALPPEDLAVLAHLRGQRQLLFDCLPSEASVARLRIPEGAQEQLPVTVALLAWSGRRPGPALTCLIAILVNAAVGLEGHDPRQRARIADLARMLRRAVEQPGAPLRALVAGATSVMGLLRHVDDELAAGNQLHVTFGRLWTNWLRLRVVRWILAEPGRLSRALETRPNLLPDIATPSLPMWGSPGADEDDQLEMGAIEVDGRDFEGLPPRAVHALATAYQLLRRSGEAGLMLHPDQLVPDELIRIVAQSSLRAGRAAIAAEQLDGAEPFLAMGFVIATGLREVDLEGVVWGAEGVDDDAVLSIQNSTFSLHLKRPPQAVDPSPVVLPLLEQATDRIHWPVPPSLHAALKGLAPNSQPRPGSPVFAVKATGFGDAYRLREVLSGLLPGVQFGASRFRLALAANLSERFGPEVAQVAMRDSFSTSLGPAYYGALPEHSVMDAVATLLTRWFNDPILLPGREGRVGSRLVLRDEVAKQWPTRLAKDIYSAARRKDAWRDHLIAERNHLAGALCAATGNRPGGSIGELLLDSIIPEYGLVVLEDKLTDLLRRTRVAVTGNRWTTALRGYLDRLIELSRKEDGAMSAWADAVLKSELPLFSMPAPDGHIVRLDMNTLRATMVESLEGVPNHYRHRLNQRLQERGVDWELRHAQLGWVVSPTFALADLSPLSPRSLGERLGSVIDEMLMDEGWYTQRQRISKWSWNGVPDRPLKDWAAVLQAYEKEHMVHVRGVRERFKERRTEIEAEILPRVAAAVSELVPALKVDQQSRTIDFASGFRSTGPVQLTMEHYALIRDRVREGDGDPMSAMEALAAEYLIHNLVSKAIESRVVAGPVPTRRHLGVTAELSSFLPGIGLAVRHAESIRRRLGEVAARNKPHDMPGIVQLSTLASTPYRNLDAAAAAVVAASKGIRSDTHREWLRIPATRDRKEEPMVFAGTGAAILARRGQEAPTAKPIPQDEFSRWISKHFGDVIACPQGDAELLASVVDTLRMSGRMELSGPERLIMDGYSVAAVATQRALAIVDGWPLRTSLDENDEVAESKEIKDRPPTTDDRIAKSSRATYLRLTNALNPSVSGSAEQRKSDGKHAWRSRLGNTLALLEREVGSTSNLGLLVQYVAHRLRHGGRKKAQLSQGNLHKEVTRFGGALLDIAGKRSLAQLESEDLQAVYLAVLCRKGANVRADVLEELKKFHRYLEDVHHLVEVDFAPLHAFAGPRVRSTDAGALTDAEVLRVLSELLVDLEHERSRKDSGPEDVRACVLRVLMFLVLEASGIRPGSAYGLVLGDFHLLERGQDFVHVHRVGEYGEAKTLTSVGFIRLEGDVWNEYREWVAGWIDQEKGLNASNWWRYPAFAEAAGSRRRFAKRYLTRRVDMLLKWASGQLKARTYWLRKRRVTARIGAAFRQPEPTARAVFRALRESGHADILTPLMHYIHDVTVPLNTYLVHADRPNRAAVLNMTALPAAPLDAIWHRNRKAGNSDFHGVVLDRLGVPIASPPEERVRAPPELYRQMVLTPRHIDTYARVMHLHGDRGESMARSGLSDIQVEVLERAIADLIIRTGCAPWRITGIRKARVVMQPARHLAGTKKLFALLDESPNEWLVVLARAWAQQGFIDRMHDPSVVMVFEGEQERSAAQALLVTTQVNLELLGSGSSGGVLCYQEKSAPTGNFHGSALRWVLAMCWLHQKLIAGN